MIPSVKCLGCEIRLSAFDLFALSISILADNAKFGLSLEDFDSTDPGDWGWCVACGIAEFGL